MLWRGTRGVLIHDDTYTSDVDEEDKQPNDMDADSFMDSERKRNYIRVC